MIRQKAHDPRLSLRKFMLPLLAFSLLCYFVYHLIQGDRGILSRRQLAQRVEVLESELSALQSTKQDLERQDSLLNPNSLCPDMLEERARSVLNLAKPDEIVIFDDLPKKPAS